LRVVHQGGGAVEAHRLRVEQRAQKGGGMVALEPRGGVGDERKARRVALGKAVLAKAADLLEDPLGEFLAAMPFFIMRVDEALAVLLDAAATSPRGHVAPQLIRLAGV
jgi:hypothetical protein